MKDEQHEDQGQDNESVVSAPEQAAQESAGALQLRFTGLPLDGNSVDAREFADSLQGLADLVADFAKSGALGIDSTPEVRVHPPQPGSLIAEVLVFVQGLDPDATGMAYDVVATTGLIAAGIRAAIAKRRNLVIATTDSGPNEVTLTFRDGSVVTVPKAIWLELSREKLATRRALRKLMAPLRTDAATMEVRSGPTSSSANGSDPIFVATPDDYQSVVEDGDADETERDFKVVATIDAVDRRDPKKWRITVEGETSRKATMGDDEFFRQVSNGTKSLNLAHEYDIELHEVSSSPNGRLKRDWTVTRVVRNRDGGNDGVDHRSLGTDPDAA